MPRFEIHVMESTIHWTTVEAPDLESAETFAGGLDMDQLHASAYPDIAIDDILEVRPPFGEGKVDFRLGPDGEILEDLRTGQ